MKSAQSRQQFLGVGRWRGGRLFGPGPGLGTWRRTTRFGHGSSSRGRLTRSNGSSPDRLRDGVRELTG